MLVTEIKTTHRYHGGVVNCGGRKMKRKHSEMIKARNDNKGLSVFVKNGGWSSVLIPSWDDGLEYFVCLERHKDAVFELLIGGKAEVLIKNKSNPEPYWSNCGLPVSGEWENKWWYMNNDVESRIKPKKQTRYAYMGLSGLLTPSYDNVDNLDKDHSEAASSDEYQLITFEAEV
jgi:hypothetical protein